MTEDDDSDSLNDEARVAAGRIMRLNRTTDIMEVRKKGHSWPHPLFVLITFPGDEPGTLRIGVIATKSVGGAVQRNRAKRLLRESVNALSTSIQPGYKVLLIARKTIIKAETQTIQCEMEKTLKKAGILIQ